MPARQDKKKCSSGVEDLVSGGEPSGDVLFGGEALADLNAEVVVPMLTLLREALLVLLDFVEDVYPEGPGKEAWLDQPNSRPTTDP